MTNKTREGLHESFALAIDTEGNTIAIATYDNRWRGPLDLGLGPLPQEETSGAVVVKLDPRGQPMWNVPISGGYGVAVGVATDAAGNVYALVHAMGPNVHAGGPGVSPIVLSAPSSLLVKITSNGVVSFATALATIPCSHLTGSALGVAVACEVTHETTIAGRPVASLSAIARTYAIVTLDSTGSARWVRRVGVDGGAADGYARGVNGLAVGESGRVGVIATAYGDTMFESERFAHVGVDANAVVFVLDADGRFVGAHTFGAKSTGHARGGGVAFDSADRLYAGGTFNGVVQLGPETWSSRRGTTPCGANASVDRAPPCSDGFIVAIDANGRSAPRARIDGTQAESLRHIGVDDCSIAAAGDFGSTRLFVDGVPVDGRLATDVTEPDGGAAYFARLGRDRGVALGTGFVSSGRVSPTGLALTRDGVRVGLTVEGELELGNVSFASERGSFAPVIVALEP